jgi:hypothetical protein
MVKKSLPLLGIPLLVLSLQGCIQDPASVSSAEEMRIRIQVSGGIAGGGFTVVLDGADRTLIGESCSSICDFSDGQVLASLTSGGSFKTPMSRPSTVRTSGSNAVTSSTGR